MEARNLILMDRSRATTDWQCHRRRFLNYDVDGRGYVPETEAYPLAFGTAIHTGLAAIAQGQVDGDIDIDVIASKARNDIIDFLKIDKSEGFILEQAALAEGLLRGLYKHIWPRLMAQYPKILAIEQEMSYKYGRTLFMAKPDLVVVDKSGGLNYIEWKTTSSKKDEWISSWNTAVQLHATGRAIENALGEPLTSIQIVGMFKGFRAYEKQNSVMCYCYAKLGNPPFSKDIIEYEYRAGLKRSPTWELPGGVKSWVENMPEEILSSQYPLTPPIFVNDQMVESFFAQRNIREQEIHLAKSMLEVTEDPETREQILDTSFSQNFSECSPAYGYGCPYKRICFGEVAEPLKQGFQVRASHHMIEADTWAIEDRIT